MDKPLFHGWLFQLFNTSTRELFVHDQSSLLEYMFTSPPAPCFAMPFNTSVFSPSESSLFHRKKLHSCGRHTLFMHHGFQIFKQLHWHLHTSSFLISFNPDLMSSMCAVNEYFISKLKQIKQTYFTNSGFLILYRFILVFLSKKVQEARLEYSMHSYSMQRF